MADEAICTAKGKSAGGVIAQKKKDGSSMSHPFSFVQIAAFQFIHSNFLLPKNTPFCQTFRMYRPLGAYIKGCQGVPGKA